ncbi:MAG TPA: CPBP family intramembrane glutamic endopeptidase [Bryobacteraceae bacterium]|nr:CPBP family intramembrane glutamic endopeptidase [Bryobacteraceae bacterium]
MSSPSPTPAPAASHWTAGGRVAVFLALAYTIQFVAFGLLQAFGTFIGATLGAFTGGAVATVLALRIYQQGTLSDIGLAWHKAAGRHLLIGVGLGAGAAVVSVGLPWLIDKAYFVPAPDFPFSWPSLLLVGIVLLFGALGEELIFRGYPFQMLAGRYGTFQILLPAAVLFAAAHAGNLNSSPLGLFNTFLWGVLLGYAVLRSGDLWLSTGIHFGWNVALPFFGVNLSGFRVGMTGYKLEWRAGPLWSGGDYGPEGSLLTLLLVVAMFFLLHRVPLSRQRLPLLPDLVEEWEEEEPAS